MPSYPLLIRLSHWINAILLVALIGSGFEIFNAHPTLYASDASDPRTAVVTLPPVPDFLTLGGWLAGGRRLHFAAALLFVANGLAYVAYMIAGGRKRAVWPRRRDLRRVGPAVRDHLRYPPILHGEGGGLNPLQKISYLGVAVLLSPFVILTGLALSPQWDAAVPFYADLFGGRQFARTWHFAATMAFVAFIVVHLQMVCLAGWSTFMRMVTGRVALPTGSVDEGAARAEPQEAANG